MNGGRERAVSHRQGRLSREKSRDFFFFNPEIFMFVWGFGVVGVTLRF